jgi:hypothetical protein
MSERIVIWEKAGGHLKTKISGVDCLVLRVKKGKYSVQVGIRHGHTVLSFLKVFKTQSRAKMVARAVAVRFAAVCFELSGVDV